LAVPPMENPMSERPPEPGACSDAATEASTEAHAPQPPTAALEGPRGAGDRRLGIRSVSACEWMERAAPMLQAHWEEIALNKALMVLKPDIEAYRALEAAGQLVSLGAFLGEEPIGYSINVLRRHLHY